MKALPLTLLIGFTTTALLADIPIAQSADMDRTMDRPIAHVADNNEEGIDSYKDMSALPTAAELQKVNPAAGGGLTEPQLNNWELHRLQRFYNGDDGVTK